ncbi:hypothetical protein RUND412_004534 [Rhizina undulata]
MVHLMDNSHSSPKRVLIVGAGAAGMSCASQLSSNLNFNVTVIDVVDYCGGQAFSIPLESQKFGADWLNQGVQGGSGIFHHTFHMFSRQGFETSPVNLQVSFGKGDNFWTNVFPTKIIEKNRRYIRRFAWIYSWAGILMALVPIRVVMRVFGFGQEFVDFMVLPAIALFLGTGNGTPDVPMVVLRQLFKSERYGMWYPADKNSFISNQPPMVVFPDLSSFYSKWKDSLIAGGVDIRLSTELVRVVSRKKNCVSVALRSTLPYACSPVNAEAATQESLEEYDELVLCVLADTAKRVLGDTASWAERFVLGSAKFSDDVTVTHHDAEYMQRHYTPHFEPSQVVTSLYGIDQSHRVASAQQPGGFEPMYYIKPYAPPHSRKLEMAFDCSAYQAQFEARDFEDHVFQTIFLNRARDSELWTIGQIDREKIIMKNWWHQLVHWWGHYLFVVPWMWWINGGRNIRFAGSWTLINAHEVAIISGLAAAYSLGARYPPELERDEWAVLCFRLYLLLTHGKWFRRGA